MLTLGLGTVLLNGCATVSRTPGVPAATEIYLKDICAQNSVYWQWDPVSQVATLEYQGAKANVLVGSDVVLVGAERVALSAPVRMARSLVIVPQDFDAKVIKRLRQKSVRREGFDITKIREIILDPGHGGKDPGAIGWAREEEKKIVLDISKRLKRILEGYGFKVRMTRETDEFISLNERTEIASRSQADLFVSIHANASPSRNVTGLEVFVASELEGEQKNEDQRVNNQGLMFGKLSMKNKSADVVNIVEDMLYDYKQAESALLAQDLARNTAKLIKTKNRGEKESRFFVLRNTLIPAILIEVGFLTNPNESSLLQTGAYRQRVAQAIAESIVDYGKRN